MWRWDDLLESLDKIAMAVPRPRVYEHDTYRSARVDTIQKTVQFIIAVRTDEDVMDGAARVVSYFRYCPDTLDLVGDEALRKRFEADQQKAVLEIIDKARQIGLNIVGPCEFSGGTIATE